MNTFSGRKKITGFLTLLCILLLSSTASAAEVTDKSQPAASVTTESNGDGNQVKESSTGADTSETAVAETAASEEIGPGIKKNEEKTEEPVITGPVYTKGGSLGVFTATAYCPRSDGSQSRTYSGTTPQPQHTISADISVLPLGTKVMIDGIVYTVEDVGSSVKGNKVDIYFASRAEALAFGRQSKELFAVIES